MSHEPPAGNLVPLRFRAPWNVPPGNLVPIRFGYEPDGPEPPEPVVRYAHVSAGAPWAHVPALRRAVRLRFGMAAQQHTGALLPWSAAPRRDAAIAAPWADVPRKCSGTLLAWSHAQRLPAAPVGIPWQQMPREIANARLVWSHAQRLPVPSVEVPWSSPPRLPHDVALPWSMLPRRDAASDLPWHNPPQKLTRVRLPWGHASLVRWVVNSPGLDPPDPSPPYQHQPPPGNLVALAFRCPRVAAVFPGNRIPIAFGRAQCFLAWPRPRRYIVLNTASVVRLPERTPIAVSSGRISSARDTPLRTVDLDLADPAHLAWLKPDGDGPKSIEVNLNGHVFTFVIERWQRSRRHLKDGGGGETVSVSGRSRPALLAEPYAPRRSHVSTSEKQGVQLIDDELDLTGFSADIDLPLGIGAWAVPAGAWNYDGLTRLSAVVRVAEAAGAVVIAHPWDDVLLVRPLYPTSPWDWGVTAADVQIPDDVILDDGRGSATGERASETVTIPLWPPSASDKPRLVEPLDLIEIVEATPHKAQAAAVSISFQRQASGNGATALVIEQTITLDPAPAEPLYNQVLVSGEQVGVSDPIIRTGTAGDVRLASIVDPLITTHAVALERGRNALAAGVADRGATNLWRILRGLEATAPQRKGNITALNGDGSYTIATADGGTIRARANPGDTWSIGVGVFVRDGRIVDSAPALPGMTQNV